MSGDPSAPPALVDAALPAILDALARARVGVVAFAHRNGRFERQYANEPALETLGYTMDEWLALPMFDTIAPEQRGGIAALYERMRTDAPLPPVIELQLVRRDGTHQVREYTVGVCEVDDDHVMVLIARDTDPGPHAFSLLEADRLALVGALAAGFAHETNNPLTSVVLNLRALRKLVVANLTDPVQANALRCVDDLSTGAERIASNVRALQTLATRSSTKLLDLSVLVSSALRLASPTLEHRAHVIRQILPVRPVQGEESRLGQAVLAMLLFSCSGFAEQPGTPNRSDADRIVVAVEDRGEHVVVEISDNGTALTPQEVEHAFDPFFRSPARGGGVGVGLGIARSIASTLGGEVTLAPRDDGGAVITMALPATQG